MISLDLVSFIFTSCRKLVNSYIFSTLYFGKRTIASDSTSCFLNTISNHFNSFLAEITSLMKGWKCERFLFYSFSPDLDKGSAVKFFLRVSSWNKDYLRRTSLLCPWNALGKLWCLMLWYSSYGHQMNVKRGSTEAWHHWIISRTIYLGFLVMLYIKLPLFKLLLIRNVIFATESILNDPMCVQFIYLRSTWKDIKIVWPILHIKFSSFLVLLFQITKVHTTKKYITLTHYSYFTVLISKHDHRYTYNTIENIRAG